MLEITPDLLLQAYRIGVFPMGERRDDPKLYWLDPRLRAVLPLDGFHLPHRLAVLGATHAELAQALASAEFRARDLIAGLPANWHPFNDEGSVDTLPLSL